MGGLDLLREQSKAIQRDLTTLVADVDDESADWRPNEAQWGIGIMYLHAVNTADIQVHVVAGAEPVIQRPGVAKTMSLAPFPPDRDLRTEWAPVALDAETFGITTRPLQMQPLRAYAQEVFGSINEVMDGLGEDDLQTEVQFAAFAPRLPLYRGLSIYAVTHLAEHSGEISCLKGLRDLKGL